MTDVVTHVLVHFRGFATRLFRVLNVALVGTIAATATTAVTAAATLVATRVVTR